MRLPDQITAEELRGLVRSYEERLAALPGPPVHVELLGVRGGRIERQAHGAVEVTPTGVLRVPLDEQSALVELVYDRPSFAQALLRTSPCRLVLINGVWQREGLTGLPRPRHLITPPEDDRLRLGFAVRTERLVCASIEDGSGEAVPAKTYIIPPAATVIIGTGRLVYASGAEVQLTGIPELLLRPDTAGALTQTDGGIYARFIGSEPATVRIGYTWATTPPIS